MSALESGGALIRVWLPSWPTRVTPCPGVKPRLPWTMRHWPTRAGLRLQVASWAEAATGNSNSTASTALITDFLQGFSCRFGEQQNSQKRNRDGGQHPLNRGTMVVELVVQLALESEGDGAEGDFDHITQRT